MSFSPSPVLYLINYLIFPGFFSTQQNTLSRFSSRDNKIPNFFISLLYKPKKHLYALLKKSS
ncbi:MAG: hypothetical protein D6799_02710 [Bacteroidetes bacterium]|nr:MAG: hypothetical protein D6799_02710 [Bacteroidota bacterium]